jgi:hypothetical protein
VGSNKGALQVIRRAAALLLVAMLGGCVTTGGGSVTGGECRVFERPPYAVRGVTQYDQDVADNFVESGVGGCKWTRPAARPAALDATPVAKHVAKPVKRRSLVARVKAKVWPGAAVAPVEAVPDMPAPTPRAAPRSVIDELLYPSDVR